MAEGRKSLRREQQNGRELLSLVKNPSPQAPGHGLWGHFLSPATALDVPQSSEQLTKDYFSAGCDLPAMPGGNVGNHLAGTNVVFGHLVGQTVSQGGIGLIVPSLP